MAGSVRVERDPAFWRSIASHPQVAPHVSLGHEIDVGAMALHPLVTPLASEHGGFLFIRLDPLGRAVELHTLFTPEGWGREVHGAAKAAFDHVFEGGAALVLTSEVEGNARSQPPRSFRFAPCGDFEPTPYGKRFRTWFLTRAAWEGSPARRRAHPCLSSPP